VLIIVSGKKKNLKKYNQSIHPQTLTLLTLQEILVKKLSLTYLAVTIVLFYWKIFCESNTSHPLNTFTSCQCCNLWKEFQNYNFRIQVHAGGS